MTSATISDTKLDLYEAHKKEYAASAKPTLVEIRPAVYLTITGQGAPGSPAFTDAIGALYGVAFTVKMTRKFAGKEDYSVCKLEALWPDWGTAAEPNWQLLIRTPEFVTPGDLRDAVRTLAKRGKGDHADRVRLHAISEGLCVQAMHIGPYENESKTIDAMRAFAEKQGMRISGPHHEIYLSDPRRCDPSKLKTILREPVSKA
ncbi:GyrI-like domain-containing protein [Occallatibacter riparius]|uniref:GyrI-like domain-containing protein n=1 Tax=Occallatibacter riparius TaxID=1002689 RepID=A0A9J7BK70_9BACT|nr:GyrI-like domain-containing protein [Occallatibacter riparius]UWZ82963.1 GyrI-like domain-containing protein [Occallatibacter riparius]